MLGRKSKADKMVTIPLEEPIFSESDKQELKTILGTQAFEKLTKYVYYRLLTRFLNMGCTDETRDGYMACISEFQNPPIDIAVPLEENKYGSMDF